MTYALATPGGTQGLVLEVLRALCGANTDPACKAGAQNFDSSFQVSFFPLRGETPVK